MGDRESRLTGSGDSSGRGDRAGWSRSSLAFLCWLLRSARPRTRSAFLVIRFHFKMGLFRNYLFSGSSSGFFSISSAHTAPALVSVLLKNRVGAPLWVAVGERARFWAGGERTSRPVIVTLGYRQAHSNSAICTALRAAPFSS